MSARTYTFRNVWSVDVAASTVFHALADLATYPHWWPDVRTVTQLDEDTAHVTCRAVLPYSLTLRMHRVEQNGKAGRLRVDLTGDLQGFCGCVIESAGSGARVHVIQEVQLRKLSLTKVEPLLAPAYRMNHTAMMWRGQRGLRSYLANGHG